MFVVYNRFGVTWGLLSVPVTLIVVLALYSLGYWAIESLFSPTDASRTRNQAMEHDESDSNKLA